MLNIRSNNYVDIPASPYTTTRPGLIVLSQKGSTSNSQLRIIITINNIGFDLGTELASYSGNLMLVPSGTQIQLASKANNTQIARFYPF